MLKDSALSTATASLAMRLSCLRHATGLLAVLLSCAPAAAAPWIAPDWSGREPTFPAGSLYWHTNAYDRCPVILRTAIDVAEKPLELAVFQARGSGFAYVFAGGRQVAAREPRGAGKANGDPTEPFAVELTHILRPGRNVLAISAGPGGIALDGILAYRDGEVRRFGSGTLPWHAQEFPPLTIIELEPFLSSDFDAGGWFPVKEVPGEPLEVTEASLREACGRLRSERLARLDEEGRWRLQMLAGKGIAIADWEAHGWAGRARLPSWVVRAAAENPSTESPSTVAPSTVTPSAPAPGALHERAEALSRHVILSDEADNLERLAVGLEALGAPATDAEHLRTAARHMREALARAGEAIRAGRLTDAPAALAEAGAASEAARKGRILNRAHHALDNKFAWFDTTRLLDSSPEDWGLRLAGAAAVLASPLSPAALVTAEGKEVTLEGWDGIPPLRVYSKPPLVTPVGIWAAVDGKLAGRKPDSSGLVYDREAGGELTENWMAIVCDMARGGGLPVEMVFLQHPRRVSFQEGGKSVRVEFDEPGARLLILRPLKEWRGYLAQARALAQLPPEGAEISRYAEQFRLWSRALLEYPVSFSEAAVRDPEDKGALRVADVYGYLRLEDAWGTEPLRLAPLPPLACYGLSRSYPGLAVLGPARTLGSWGVWGDHVAAVGKDHIAYRVPLDPLPRSGGFTAYCFGPTDIGEPGSLTEIQTIRLTGANSFRPQHNSTGDRALRTAGWCRDEGIQCVFNIDEKWIPDAVEHYRRLAEACKDFPPWAIAYDLLNEPETREPRAYGAFVRKITAAIREVDRTHPIYVEAMPPWGPGAKPFPQGAFETLEPTGDPLTVYSFHDYEYRLPERWPNETADSRDLLGRWIPAFRFAIDHRSAIHLGEFGGFEQTKQSVHDNPCALTMMLDFLEIFDRFGWHWHYYSNRGLTRVRRDGSLQESYVQEACRRYFSRGTFNAHRG